MKFDVVVMGELLVDFTESGRSPAGQRLFEQNPGGAVANVACGAARLGLSSAFIGKVGEDMHGRFLKATLEDTGVCTDGLLMSESVFTTLAFVSLAPSGEREFSFARKPGADTAITPAELNADILKNCTVFHVGSLSMTDEPARSATLRAIDLAKAAGAVISCDPNYRANLWQSPMDAVRQMRVLLSFADLVKISDEEALLLTGETEPERALDCFLANGAKCAVVTLGSEGAVLGYGSVRKRVPAFKVDPAVDTTGAGDAFWAAFLSRVIKNGSLDDLNAEKAEQYVRFANAAAAICVSRRGGIPAMPSQNEVEALLG